MDGLTVPWSTLSFARELARCRGCLGLLDRAAQAGLCGRCWAGLTPLPEERCPFCALSHGWSEACPDPVAWTWGDALWDYHGGLGSLLVPAIKRGELGWKDALLKRARAAPLPPWTAGFELVVNVPTARWRRWWRGFDLAEETAALMAGRLGAIFQKALRKPLWARPQAGLPQSQRRRAPARVARAPGLDLRGKAVLLVDDVWTTGTTLYRCAQVLGTAGVREVAVLTLFRAGRRGRA